MQTTFRRFMVLFGTTASVVTGSCLPIQGDRILARDLAAAIPLFQEAAGRTLSPAPLAGAQRRFPRQELRRLARSFGLSDSEYSHWPDSVCFAYPLAPLGRDTAIEAIRRSVGSEIAFEMTEYSLFPVPPGEAVFKNVSFRPDRPDGTRLLTGRVEYARGRHAPIWARVRMLTKPNGLVAAMELRPGVQLQAEHVQTSPVEVGATNYLTTAAQVEGLTVRRRIAAGTPLTMNMLMRRPAVSPGETVVVNVRSGSTQLSFESRAETAGHAGDLILLKNPDSGQKFQARVEGPARAYLLLSTKENSCCLSSR